MATLVHFDISVTNPERARLFYEGLFSWKFTLLPGPQPYYLISTSHPDGTPGIGGGMSGGSGPANGITNFIGVASVEESLSKVVQLGGRILQPPSEVPGWGVMAVCLDSEGNRIGLFQETSTGSQS